MTFRSFLFQSGLIFGIAAMWAPHPARAQESAAQNPAPAAKAADTPAKEAASPSDAAKENAESAQTAAPAHQIDGAAQLLGKLKPENLRILADVIEQDWSDRPEWAEMAIAVMRGQAMQPGKGWWRSTEKKYGWTWLKRKYDKNSDNAIELQEFPLDSDRAEIFFERLDRDLDNKITTADFDVSVFQGATPAALQARLTEALFFELDIDTNGQVSEAELSAFFKRADREQMAFLTAEDILSALVGESSQPPASESSGPTNSDLLGMLFSGQLGWFEEGPKLGDLAADFKLATHDGSGMISLSESRDKKPVVLIFGSFT